MSFFETGDAIFNPNLEKIKPTDRVHADVPNQRFDQLINNDVALKNQLDKHNHNGSYADINHNHSEYVESGDLENKLNGVAKESQEKLIENTVKNIETQVGNINSNINQNLQGVAKESSRLKIENTLLNLASRIEKLEKREKIYYGVTKENYNANTISSQTTIFNKNGKGFLQYFYGQIVIENASNSSTASVNVQFIVDDKVIWNLDAHANNSTLSRSTINIGLYTNTNVKNSRTGTNPSPMLYFFLKPDSTTKVHNVRILEGNTPFTVVTAENVQVFEKTSSLQKTAEYNGTGVSAWLIEETVLEFNKNIKLTITPKNNGTIKNNNIDFYYKFIN